MNPCASIWVTEDEPVSSGKTVLSYRRMLL
jgi:hypothetical protein